MTDILHPASPANPAVAQDRRSGRIAAVWTLLAVLAAASALFARSEPTPAAAAPHAALQLPAFNDTAAPAPRTRDWLVEELPPTF